MPSRRELVRMSPEGVAEFLAEETVGVLGTIGPKGFPHQVSIGFTPLNGGAITMQSWTKAQKVVNLRRNPRASLLVERMNVSYSEIKGVLLTGDIELDDDLDRVRSVLQEIQLRAQTLRAGLTLPPLDIERVAPKRTNLIMTVDWMTSWDHTKLAGIY